MKYFSIKELCRSRKAEELKINNTPDEKIKRNLELFIETVLDPIREDWGSPIIVSSGWRSKRLNQAVGGVMNSGHLYGFCADLQVSDVRKFADFVYRWMLDHHMSWDEMLFESSGGVTWLHLSWIGQDGKQRKKRFDIIK